MKSETYNMDCMEYMRGLPDKEFALAIVDPPYGIQTSNLTGFKKKCIQYEQTEKCSEWDKKPPKEYFDELFRVSKNQIIWGVQYFTDMLPPFSQLIVWDKETGDNYFADGEAAYCSIKGTLRIFRHQWCGCFKDSERDEKAIHVNQKPIALYKWLLSHYAHSGDRILDTHLGSGSSRIACHDMGFDFVGIEIDKDYFEAEDKRYSDHVSQLDLIKPEETQQLQFAVNK